MIALLTACLFFFNPCARAELHQRKHARKLCSATLRTFARKFSNIDLFLKILPLKNDELVMSEM